MPSSTPSPRVAATHPEPPDLPPCGLAAAILSQAQRWLDHTRGYLDPDYAARKLVESLAFSARCTAPVPCVRRRTCSSRPSGCLAGDCGKASCRAAHEAAREAVTPPSLAVPTKLCAVATPERQALLRHLANTPGGLRLHLVRHGSADDPERIVVHAPRQAFDAAPHGPGEALDPIGLDLLDPGIPIGQIQAKHVRWLGPLVGRGAYAVLLQVTGGTPERPTHGANVALSGLDYAVRAVSAQADPRRPSRRAV